MNKNLIHRWLLAMALSVAALSLYAAPSTGEWQVLSRAHLQSTQQLAMLKVFADAQDTVYRTLKFHVSHSEVRLTKAKVYFKGGGSVDVSIQKNIKAGFETRPLPISAHQRGIEKVEISYRIASKRPAEIALLGLADQG